MSDNINVYMDNLLEVYTDLQDVVVNPVTPVNVLRKDLQEYYDTVIDNVENIDEEYRNDPDKVVLRRVCCILSGIRMTVCNRFSIFINIEDTDSEETIKRKEELTNLLLRYENRITEIISNYYKMINSTDN